MPARAERSRGSVEKLPSGALRLKAYAGYDPLTKRRHYLSETIPPGPTAERQARAARDRLLVKIAARRNRRTKATVDQLLERYLDQFNGAESTKTLYRGYIASTSRPTLVGSRSGRLTPTCLIPSKPELLLAPDCTSIARRSRAPHGARGPDAAPDRHPGMMSQHDRTSAAMGYTPCRNAGCLSGGGSGLDPPA